MDEDAQFSEEENANKSENDEEAEPETTSTIPFEIDIDNGKTTLRLIADAKVTHSYIHNSS
jgi:hypothetical protein